MLLRVYKIPNRVHGKIKEQLHLTSQRQSQEQKRRGTLFNLKVICVNDKYVILIAETLQTQSTISSNHKNTKTQRQTGEYHLHTRAYIHIYIYAYKRSCKWQIKSICSEKSKPKTSHLKSHCNCNNRAIIAAAVVVFAVAALVVAALLLQQRTLQRWKSLAWNAVKPIYYRCFGKLFRVGERERGRETRALHKANDLLTKTITISGGSWGCHKAIILCMRKINVPVTLITAM